MSASNERLQGLLQKILGIARYRASNRALPRGAEVLMHCDLVYQPPYQTAQIPKEFHMRTFAVHSVLMAAAALNCATAAHAASDGFYIGLGGGHSDFAQGLATQIRSAYAGRSDYSLESAALVDNSDTAWKATLGYRFLPWLSAELAWTDGGDATSAFALRSLRPLTNGVADLHGRYQLTGTSLALVGDWPLGDTLAVSARGGFVASRLKYDEQGLDAASHPYSFHGPSDNNSGGLAGLGFSWRPDPQWELRLDWDRWFNVGTRFDVQTDTNGKFDHVDLYTLNLFYRFRD